VICHNANCAGPPDPSRDDTLGALRASLALTYEGRPVLDGAELDVFWHGKTGRCLFAHDANSTEPAEARAAAEEIGRHLQRPGDVSWNGERFYIRMELKGFVGGSFDDKHSPEQARAHAGCAIDLFEVFDRAAARGGRSIVVIFDSSSPQLLRAVTAHERWPGKTPNPRVQTRLSADFVDSTPSGLARQKLSDFPAVDDVVFHAGWVADGHYQAFRSLDLQMTLWMFSATAETFGAIARLEPDAVLTSEAPLLRRWIAW
jgi:hypothetical protein